MRRLFMLLSLSISVHGQISTASARAQGPAQWIPMGPFGGSAAVIEVDASRPGTLLAAANNGLLFRSRDSGDSWLPVGFPAQLRSTLHAFAVAPGAYYAGISSDSRELSGLYRSSDEGSTWIQIPGLKGKEVWSLALFGADGKILSAGTRDGVYLSSDSGNQWKHISPADNAELAPVVSLAFDPKDSATLYAGTPHLPWKTADGGANWHSIHDGMLDDSDVFSIHVDSRDPRRVFASACSGIYRSENAAGSWRKMNGAAGASYRTYIIRQDPSNPNLVFAGTTFGLSKSNDGGVTWRKVSPDATRWISFDPANEKRLYIATDEAGLLRSDDSGDTFTPINRGFCNRQLPAFTATPEAIVTASIYERDHGGVYELKSGEPEWELIVPAAALPAELLRLESATESGGSMIFGLGYTSLLTSADLGKKWTSVPEPARGLKLTGFLGASVNRYFAATETGLFRFDLPDRKWTSVILPGSPASPKILVLAPLGKAGLAAATSDGIFVSETGESWKTTAPLPVSGAAANISLAGGRGLIAGTTAGLIRSDDFGASWEPVLWGLGPATVSATCQHPLHPNTVFAAQYGVVYQSDDSGNNWRAVSGRSQIGIEVIKALAVLPGSPDRLVALTQRQGTFALPLSTSTATSIHSASISGRTEKTNTVR